MSAQALCVAFLFVQLVCLVHGSPAYGAAEEEPNGNSNGHVGKRVPSNRYTDQYDRSRTSDSRTCSDSFVDKSNYIIRTKESLENDAIFIDAIKERTSSACVSRCCDEQDVIDDDGKTVSCDAAVFVDGGDEFEKKDSNCFLFQCRFDSGEGNRCRFSDHDGYISSMIHGFGEEPEFEGDREDESEEKEEIPQTTAAPPATTRWRTEEKKTDKQEDVCDDQFFRCNDGKCIRSSLVCDKYQDCDDNSDEDEERCAMLDGLWKIWRYMYGSSAADYTTEYPPVAPPADSDVHEEGQDEDEVDDDDDNKGTEDDAKDGQSKGEKLPTTNGIVNTDNKQGNSDITNKPADTQKSLSPVQISSQDGPSSNKNQTNSKTAKENPPSKSLSSSGYHHSDVKVVEKQGVTATAVLPLTIGLFLTLFLLLMMSCRLRYMNQRLRYGRLKTNNAHDADYLINGMYL